MYKFGERSKNNLIGIHPDLVAVMNKAITNSPFDFTIVEGVRTVERQQELYAKGRKTAGAIVTNCDGVRAKSSHQVKDDGYGYAVDLYAYYDGSVQTNDVVKLKAIAAHIKHVSKKLGIKIEWGGDWKTIKDYPHFELGIRG